MKIGKVVTLMSKMCLSRSCEKKIPNRAKLETSEKNHLSFHIFRRALVGHSSERFLCTKPAPPAAVSRPATLHRGQFPNLGAERDFAAAVPGCGGWAVSGWEPGGLCPVLPRAGMKPVFMGWDLEVAERWGCAGQGASHKGCAMGVGSAGSAAR